MAEIDGGGVKRVISPEHLRKLQEGRQRRLEENRQPQAWPGGVVDALPDAGPAPKPGPFSFPRPVTEEPEGPRLVRLAEVKMVQERFWPLILQRFPEARSEMVRGQLALATRGERHRLYMSEAGLALFELRQTAWEPQVGVATVFCLGHDAEVLSGYGEAWARDIRASYFEPDHMPNRTYLDERKALSS